MNAEEVFNYLLAHPDFLAKHSELLTEMTVPHPHGGQAISLAERQLHALRDKIRMLEIKLAEMIRFGEENDEISAKVHRLSLALLKIEDYDALSYILLRSLREDFAVPNVAFRIWNSMPANDAEAFLPVSDELRFYVGNLEQPYCGTPENAEIMQWFGEASPRIRSIALIPMVRDAKAFGLLALGSEEETRFYAGMGTFYLSRIGELAEAALQGDLVGTHG